MGQVQSRAATAAEPQGGLSSSPSTSSANDNSSQLSLGSLIAVYDGYICFAAEAAAYAEENENESLGRKAQKALECPCIAHLRTGPCGSQFSDAFLCFLKSTAEEKGSDCFHPFVALQNCIKVNPDAFSNGILDNVEIKKKEKQVQEYKIYPPFWSVESKKSKESKT